MAVTLPSVYQDGTATIAASGTVVTGQSTLWTKAILPGDFFGVHKGYAVRILSVDTDTQLTLANTWPGGAQTTAHYEIMLQSDIARMQETSRQLLQQLSNGNIAAFSGLTGAADTLGYFTGPGTMALTSLTSVARTLLAATDKAGQRAAIGAQADLGFTPVQQGGGPNQGTNKLRVGWGATASKLLLQVDNTDYAGVWPISVTGDAATIAGNTVATLYAAMGGSRSSAANGYAILPGGAKFMWGRNAVTTTANGDFTVLFPTSFSSFRQITAMNGDYTVGGSLSFAENVSAGQPGSGFNARAYAGTAPVVSSGIWVAWHALGV